MNKGGGQGEEAEKAEGAEGVRRLGCKGCQGARVQKEAGGWVKRGTEWGFRTKCGWRLWLISPQY